MFTLNNCCPHVVRLSRNNVCNNVFMLRSLMNKRMMSLELFYNKCECNFIALIKKIYAVYCVHAFSFYCFIKKIERNIY